MSILTNTDDERSGVRFEPAIFLRKYNKTKIGIVIFRLNT